MTLRHLLWPAFFGVVLLAWAALWAMGQQVGGPAGLHGGGIRAVPGHAGAGDFALAPLAAMWAAMAAAMMLPGFAPAFATFLALPSPAGRPAEAAGLAAGYLAVWLAAALGFAALQSTLARLGFLAADGRSLSAGFTALLFVGAGAYQFSSMKAACLSRCRSPLASFLARWRPGPLPAFAIGLRMGADCLGCCWALMALAFVGGMANLLWMGLATFFMVLEKLPEVGRPLTRPLGFALVAAGGGFAIRALGG